MSSRRKQDCAPRAGLSRRQFLKRAALAGGALAAPLIVPGPALGLGGAVAPSERIVLGGIGINSRGGAVLNWMLNERDIQFTAICDIRKERREAVKNMVDGRYGNRDCAMYRDLRDFLAERGDVDAVLIATGDRWHAPASIMAMKAGKDVYCEKPGSMTIAEGRALAETARRCGRVFQTGTQRRSQGGFVFASELARTGRLGRVHTVYAHIAAGSAIRTGNWLPAEPEPPRDEVDWDLWLGPCPWRPYNSRYVSGGWRGHFDFHTGDIGEWGSHTIAQCQMALDADDTSPVEYELPDTASADEGVKKPRFADGVRIRDNATGEGLVARYAGGVEMILTRQGWHGSCGVRFEGSEGWASIADGYGVPEVSSREWLAEYERIVGDYMTRTGRPMNHVRDFLNCVRSRRQTVANQEVCHRSMSACHCANICLWLGRNLKWNPEKEEFVGDSEANRLRSRAMREPWRI